VVNFASNCFVPIRKLARQLFRHRLEISGTQSARWKGKIRLTTIFTSFLVCQITIISSCHSAAEKDQQNTSHENEVFTSLEKGQCSKVWQLLLPAVKKKDSRTLLLLLKIHAAYDFGLPGAPNDKLSRIRRLLTLGVHGFSPNDPIGRESTFGGLEILVRAGVNEARSVQRCFAEARDPRTIRQCQAQAVEFELVPAFADFLEEVTTKLSARQDFACKPFHRSINSAQ
jgi:hypothetical protein